MNPSSATEGQAVFGTTVRAPLPRLQTGRTQRSTNPSPNGHHILPAMYRSKGTQTSPRLDPFNDYPAIPPWEIEDIAQVPRLSSTSPKLSQAEREALPLFWAARSTTELSRRPKAEAQGRTITGSKTGTPIAVHGPKPLPSPPHTNYNKPVPAVPPRPAIMPLDGVQAPPSPPDSVQASSVNTSPPKVLPPRQVVNPMSGTMSSRPVPPPRKTRPSNPCRQCGHQRNSSTRLQRFRSVVKGAFVYRSEEDLDFERIETRHWADE